MGTNGNMFLVGEMQGECLLKAPRPRDAGDAPPSLICRHCPGNAARVYPRVARAQINFVELVAPAPPQGSSIEKTRETLTGSDLATTKDLDTGFTTALRPPPRRRNRNLEKQNSRITAQKPSDVTAPTAATDWPQQLDCRIFLRQQSSPINHRDEHRDGDEPTAGQ